MEIRSGIRLAHTITDEAWHLLSIEGKKSEAVAIMRYTQSKYKAGQELTISVKNLQRLIDFNLIKIEK